MAWVPRDEPAVINALVRARLDTTRYEPLQLRHLRDRLRLERLAGQERALTEQLAARMAAGPPRHRPLLGVWIHTRLQVHLAWTAFYRWSELWRGGRTEARHFAAAMVLPLLLGGWGAAYGPHESLLPAVWLAGVWGYRWFWARMEGRRLAREAWSELQVRRYRAAMTEAYERILRGDHGE